MCTVDKPYTRQIHKDVRIMNTRLITTLVVALVIAIGASHSAFAHSTSTDSTATPTATTFATSGMVPGNSNCPSSSQRASSLVADQSRVLSMLGTLTTLRSPLDQARLALRGYPIPSHQAVSFRDLGVAFAAPAGLLGVVPSSGGPTLLMYAPRPGANSTDAYGFDYPLTLVGWAYSASYKPTVRPTIPGLCINRADWFFHEQGVHPFNNWGYVPTPPRESVLGAAQGSLIQQSGPLGVYHARIWDIHVFRNNFGGVPTIWPIKAGSGISGIDPMVSVAFPHPAV